MSVKLLCPWASADLNRKKKKILFDKRNISSDDGDFVKVKFARAASVYYKVSKKEWSCNCGESEVTKRSCQHSIEACEYVGENTAIIYRRHDLVVT
jgi:hypothetical protein